MSKDLIMFATADWAEQYWTNKQRMADQFAQHGIRVLYIESFGLRTPGANKKDVKRLLRRLWSGLCPPKQVQKNIWVLSPLVIPRWQNKTIAKINYFLLRCQIKLFSYYKKFQNPVVWTYHPFITPLLPSIDPKASYYHVVDNITAVPNVDSTLYLATEKEFLENASAIFVTSHTLQKYYQALSKTPVYYSPNVVDVGHFAKARDIQSEPSEMQMVSKPRLLYYGVLSDFKIDLAILIALAEKKPEWQFIFIGEEREGQASPRLHYLKNLSNTHFLGYRPYSQLPHYLAAVDVGILPLQDNAYTKYMFPMKFFEFLAAGVPVVSAPIDALTPYHHLFSSAKTADEFITQIENQLDQKVALLTVDEMQKNYSWDARMAQVLAVIG
jgi:glycosyltransferase involved in cell wall biosynthesis